MLPPPGQTTQLARIALLALASAVVTLATAAAARASCNVIPSSGRAFASALGDVT